MNKLQKLTGIAALVASLTGCGDQPKTIDEKLSERTEVTHELRDEQARNNEQKWEDECYNHAYWVVKDARTLEETLGVFHNLNECYLSLGYTEEDAEQMAWDKYGDINHKVYGD